jgi:hypothetical protein
MALNSLYPSFVVMDYHTNYGSHKMTLPCRQWVESAALGGSGSFESWVSGDVDADEMIQELVERLVPFWKAHGEFDLYTIYNYPTEESEPVPVATKAIGLNGTNAGTYWDKAVQTTFTFRTSAFGIMRLVMLDAMAPTSFDKILSFDASPEAVALFDILKSDDWAWAGRDNGHINVMTQISYTLNESLRRKYNMN